MLSMRDVRRGSVQKDRQDEINQLLRTLPLLFPVGVWCWSGEHVAHYRFWQRRSLRRLPIFLVSTLCRPPRRLSAVCHLAVCNTTSWKLHVTSFLVVLLIRPWEAPARATAVAYQCPSYLARSLEWVIDCTITLGTQVRHARHARHLAISFDN